MACSGSTLWLTSTASRRFLQQPLLRGAQVWLPPQPPGHHFQLNLPHSRTRALSLQLRSAVALGGPHGSLGAHGVAPFPQHQYLKAVQRPYCGASHVERQKQEREVLVVMCGWMGVKPRYLRKYEEMYQSFQEQSALGTGVAAVTPKSS